MSTRLIKQHHKKVLLEIAMRLMMKVSCIEYNVNRHDQENGKDEQNVNNNMNCNELQLLDKKLNKMNEWNHDGANMRNLNFVQDIVNCYPKSIEIARKQTNERVKSTCKHFKPH